MLESKKSLESNSMISQMQKKILEQLKLKLKQTE